MQQKSPLAKESHPTTDLPASPEESVMGLLMQLGRMLRTRYPEDAVEPSCFPLAKPLLRGPLRISDLANRCGLDTSTVSRHIKLLEDRGIVSRKPDTDDGRASLVSFTQEGSELIRAAFRRRMERIGAVLEPWSDSDRSKLRTLLVRLAADLRQANDDHDAASRP